LENVRLQALKSFLAVVQSAAQARDDLHVSAPRVAAVALEPSRLRLKLFGLVVRRGTGVTDGLAWGI